MPVPQCLALARHHNASATMPCTGTAPQCQHHNALHWHGTTMPASQCLALAQHHNASITMPCTGTDSQCLALAQHHNASITMPCTGTDSQCLALARHRNASITMSCTGMTSQCQQVPIVLQVLMPPPLRMDTFFRMGANLAHRLRLCMRPCTSICQHAYNAVLAREYI